MKCQGSPSGAADPAVVELSHTLNKMAKEVSGRNGDFRNPNGVHMKIMNYRRFDPKFISKGKTGLERGGKGEEYVWNDFANNTNKLKTTAETILATIDQEGIPQATSEIDDEVAEATEGRLLTRVHLQRERNRALVKTKKARVLEREGKLECEACGFDFKKVYGERGHGFIEAHHTQPVHTLTPGSKTKAEDLILLCSNCHRMIHAKRSWLTLEELQQLLAQS